MHSTGRQRLLASALIAALLSSNLGCFSVRGEAPPQTNVRLLPAGAPAEVTRKYQTFYYAWGLYPMTPADQPAYIIAQEKLVEARITQGGLIEGIIAGFLGSFAIGGFILPQNITIEGNRAHPPTAVALEPTATESSVSLLTTELPEQTCAAVP